MSLRAAKPPITAARGVEYHGTRKWRAYALRSYFWFEAQAADSVIARSSEYEAGGGRDQPTRPQNEAYNTVLSQLASNGWQVIPAGHGLVRRMQRP